MSDDYLDDLLAPETPTAAALTEEDVLGETTDAGSGQTPGQGPVLGQEQEDEGELTPEQAAAASVLLQRLIAMSTAPRPTRVVYGEALKNGVPIPGVNVPPGTRVRVASGEHKAGPTHTRAPTPASVSAQPYRPTLGGRVAFPAPRGPAFVSVPMDPAGSRPSPNRSASGMPTHKYDTVNVAAITMPPVKVPPLTVGESKLPTGYTTDENGEPVAMEIGPSGSSIMFGPSDILTFGKVLDRFLAESATVEVPLEDRLPFNRELATKYGMHMFATGVLQAARLHAGLPIEAQVRPGAPRAAPPPKQ